MAQIFHQLRGHKVELAIASDANPISGTVAGVERRHLTGRDQQVIDNDFILLRTEAGLRSVPVDSITLTKFLDEKTNEEFQQALDLLAESRKQDRKTIKLDFRGKGPREVSVGYVQESPVWKTSYRLVIGKDKPPFLQGWAIVENTTAQDWTEIDLTLMSGRPISFKIDLYQPLFASRPIAELDLHTSVESRRHNQDLAAGEDEFLAAGRKVNPVASDIPRPPEANGKHAAMMGGMGGGMGGMGGGMGFGGAVTAANTPRKKAPMDLAQGISSATSADDVGESFRYVIKTPVSLRRNESSMLPIVNGPVQGEKVYIFNPSVHVKHPLAGLRLKNSTDLHLQQGPITVFEDDEYAGDAQIADIPPGSTRLISYAMDLDTEVVADAPLTKLVLVGLSIQGGGLVLRQHATRKSQYLVKNSGAVPKVILIEQPVDPGWPIVEPKSAEKTRDLYRFSTTAAPGKPATVTVTEAKDVVENLVLRNLDPKQVDLYIRSDRATPALQNALKELLRRRTVLDGLSSKRAAVEQSIREETAEQQRLRENLKSLAENDPLQQRFVKKLSASEDSLESLRKELSAARTEENQFNQDYEKFAADLAVP